MPDLRAFAVPVAAIILASCASGGTRSDPSATPVRALPAEAPPAPVDAMPSGFRAAFAAADMRARAIVYYQQCMTTVLQLRAGGRFGAASSAPRAVYCARTADGVPLGGVYDIDSAFTRPRRLTVIRMDGDRSRYTEAIDTMLVSRQAQLVRDITRSVGPAWRKLARPFFVIPLPQDDGTLEGWVIPYPTRARSAVLGGDLAMSRAADGSLARLIDRTASWTQVPIPATGAVRLTSTEREIAAVSELVVARGLADLGRQVAVVTASANSALVAAVDPGTGSRVSWQHTRIAH